MKYRLLVVMDDVTRSALERIIKVDGRSRNDEIRRLIHDRDAQLAPAVAVKQQEQQEAV